MARCKQRAISRTSFGALSPGMIDGVLPFQNDLRNGDERVALLQQVFNDAWQRLRSVLRCIVEQNDTSGLDFGGYSLGNICSG